LISLLPDYKLQTIAIDVNADDLEKNDADQKIISDLSELNLSDKSVDITVCRYVLAWNNIETQKEILKEIKRITKKLVVIQHQGANSENPAGLQKASEVLFGGVIPNLKRENFFFSTAEQVENMFNELRLNFQKIQTKEVPGLSGVFIDKYNLSGGEARKVQEVLMGADYVTLSTWVIEL
jgi:ubiquinone/menaquinone biosynthesis C-methylase UbiE